jgi:hypothetical protein
VAQRVSFKYKYYFLKKKMADCTIGTKFITKQFAGFFRGSWSKLK